ncbi:MAG: hypothetical protein H9W81_01100 [Enterococcus sp.]|nr:hypothetical protein [Enterococcus sp.]
MRIKNALGILNTVVTVKALWWDKLSKEEKQKHIATAKSFLNHGATVAQEKTKEYAEKAKAKKSEATSSTPKSNP